MLYVLVDISLLFYFVITFIADAFYSFGFCVSVYSNSHFVSLRSHEMNAIIKRFVSDCDVWPSTTTWNMTVCVCVVVQRSSPFIHIVLYADAELKCCRIVANDGLLFSCCIRLVVSRMLAGGLTTMGEWGTGGGFG